MRGAAVGVPGFASSVDALSRAHRISSGVGNADTELYRLKEVLLQPSTFNLAPAFIPRRDFDFLYFLENNTRTIDNNKTLKASKTLNIKERAPSTADF